MVFFNFLEKFQYDVMVSFTYYDLHWYYYSYLFLDSWMKQPSSLLANDGVKQHLNISQHKDTNWFPFSLISVWQFFLCIPLL